MKSKTSSPIKPKKGKIHKSNRGGSRTGSGRKPASDPKIGLTIYIFQSEVDLLGGKEIARTLAVDHLKTRVHMIKLERDLL